MKKYKYILLDWDGNLAKTLDIWLEAFREVLESQGIHKTDNEIAMSFGQFPKYAELWGIADGEQAMQDTDVIAKRLLPEVDLYPDALEVLQNLHETGHKLALISTSSRENIIHLLESHSIDGFFDAVVAGDETKNHKPHPEPLEKGLEVLGGNKAEAVMIGDSDKDLGAAQNAGVDSILFYPQEHEKFYNIDELKMHNPTYVVEDFRKILDLV